MKNLKVILQKSIGIFVAVFIIACDREVEQDFVPSSLPFESVKIYPNDGSNMPISTSDLDISGHSRYLTLYDAALKNAIIIKVKTEDMNLLASINQETVNLIALEKFIPEGATYEKAKTNKLVERSALKPIEIEVLETKLQKNIKFFGIKFVRTDLIKAYGSYEFIFKNTNVSAVHVVGKDGIQEFSKFIVMSSACEDCGSQVLASRYLVASNMISYFSGKPSRISLQTNAKFNDDLLVLW